MIDRVSVVVWFTMAEGMQVEVFAEAHEAINFATAKAERFTPALPTVTTCDVLAAGVKPLQTP